MKKEDREAIGKLMGKLSQTETIVISQGKNGRDWVITTSKGTAVTEEDFMEDAEKLLLFLWCQIPSGTTNHLIELIKMPREDLDKLVGELIQKHNYREKTE